jgi:hypothetical protein
MFRLLAASVVVATIFAFSPERRTDDALTAAGTTAADRLAGALADSAPAKLAAETAARAALADGVERARGALAAPPPPSRSPGGRPADLALDIRR